MDAWAVKYFGRASFICVGCDGPELATTFATRLRLSKCLLTYVDRQNNPRWGQLGCNGFIVLDGQGKVACRKTSAYLEVHEQAFSHVESLLGPLINGAPLPALCPGQHVEIFGLSRAELNGTRGFVVEQSGSTDGRCCVATYFGQRLAVREANVRVLGESESEGEDGGEGAAATLAGSDE